MDYWMRLGWDHWLVLAQNAFKMLSCPAASVLLERTFSTTGGIVTDKHVQLALKNVDWLTF